MMVNGERQLPDGWELKIVGELYDVLGGGTPSTSVPEYWDGDIPWITSADIAGLKNIQPRKHITKDAIANSATNLVPAGSLIVVTRVSLGKVALTSSALCFSQDSQALIAKNGSVLPEYALYYLAQATQIFRHQGRGTTISGVTKKQLKELPFPLPPLPEQERIVAKIEELFTQLEAGMSALAKVQAGLRRYKASVLKAAVEGRLLENVGAHGMRPSGRTPSARTDQLPEGWQWTTVGEIVKVGTGATPLRSKEKYWKNGKIPWVTSGALNDLFVNKTYEFITDLALKETNVKIFPAGTLLIAMYGEGKTRGKVSELMIDATTNQACAALVFDKDTSEHKPYIKLFFQNIYEDIRRLSSGGVQPNLNLSIIKNTRLPLPPLEEQRRIVAEVERRLSVARQVESSVEEALVRASRLRQGILRSAFEGKLV